MFAGFPATVAEILLAEVQSGVGEDGVVYTPAISYRYTVAGEEFVGRKYYSVADFSVTRRMAERAIAKLQVGGEVRIQFNPADPGESFVENGPYTNAIAWCAGGLAFIAVGVGMALA